MAFVATLSPGGARRPLRSSLPVSSSVDLDAGLCAPRLGSFVPKEMPKPGRGYARPLSDSGPRARRVTPHPPGGICRTSLQIGRALFAFPEMPRPRRPRTEGGTRTAGQSNRSNHAASRIVILAQARDRVQCPLNSLQIVRLVEPLVVLARCTVKRDGQHQCWPNQWSCR